MNDCARRKHELEDGLRRALERDEFSVHYQPLRDVSSGEIAGAEALLRWEAPDLGFVSPAEFIPVAEETGLITAIGEWVLRTACSQAQAWQDAGFLPIRMSVNLSSHQLRSSTFVETVSKTLEESRLSPDFLEFEITESTIIENTDASDATFFELHDLGIAFALDDFGPGYSSLSDLKRYPISRVKVDCSFVSQLLTDPDDAALATAIIVMAHSLGLSVVAEGVETLEQAEFLREAGCDVLQGFLMSPAVSAEKFGQFLRQAKRE
jgi:EAL domain-containing protein (putative c-di-GMP-specific phosphodiesterase class I)